MDRCNNVDAFTASGHVLGILCSTGHIPWQRSCQNAFNLPSDIWSPIHDLGERFNSNGDEVDPYISCINEELPRPEPSEVPSQEPKSKKQARNDRGRALRSRGTSDGTD